jgi:hypothetical protein
MAGAAEFANIDTQQNCYCLTTLQYLIGGIWDAFASKNSDYKPKWPM